MSQITKKHFRKKRNQKIILERSRLELTIGNLSLQRKSIECENFSSRTNNDRTPKPPDTLLISVPNSHAINNSDPVFEPEHTAELYHVTVNHETSLQKKLACWAVSSHISRTNLNQLLHILRTVNDPDDLKKFPSDGRTLLNVTYRKHEIVDFTHGGTYYHFGLEEEIVYVLNHNKANLTSDTILIDINIDGLPLTKSSNSQFWPILGSIAISGLDKPFVVGVYHGLHKPKDIFQFLEPLLNEYKLLTNSGIHYNNRVINIRFSKFILDAPAKSFILCVKGHNAYHGCTKCTTEGVMVNNRMCFPDLNNCLRTNEGFRNGMYEDYHIGATPLLSLDIDIIKSFVLDYMHLVCLGVMKRLLLFWVKGNMNIRMSKEDYSLMNNQLLLFRKCINSNDFARLPRTLNELDRWKASEFRNFLLYTGPIVLKNRIKNSQYVHFLSLHCSIRILCTPDICIKHNSFAKELICYFINNFSKLYGQEFINHNVHNLIHLPDDVLMHGPLDAFSAFKYENFMYSIKKLLKTSKSPLQQFINRINELKKHSNSVAFNRENQLYGELDTYFEPFLLNDMVKSFNRIYINYFDLGPGMKNNHCLLKCGDVVKITKILLCVKSDDIFFCFRRYAVFKNYFDSPCKSKLFFCGSVDRLSDTCEILPIKEIATKVLNFKGFCISYIHTKN